MPEEAATGVSALRGMNDIAWRKSKRSNPSGNCVELGVLPGGEVAVRNSRFTEGPVLVCTKAEIATFIGSAKAGELDDLIA